MSKGWNLVQEFLIDEPFGEGDSLVVRVRESASNEFECVVITTLPVSPNHPTRRYKVEKYRCADVSTLGDLKATYEDNVSMDRLAREDVHVIVVQLISADQDEPETIYDVRENAGEDELTDEVEETEGAEETNEEESETLE